MESKEKMPTKASSILYTTSVVFLFTGCMLTLLEMLSRPKASIPDTLIEMWEWNVFSQAGMIGFVLGLFMFWLGLITDRRGA